MDNDTSTRLEEKAAMEHVRGVKEFWSHLLMYLVFAIAFLVTVGPGHPFIFWGGIGWGIGVILHGLIAYELINFFSPGWERKMIEKRLGRKL